MRQVAFAAAAQPAAAEDIAPNRSCIGTSGKSTYDRAHFRWKQSDVYGDLLVIVPEQRYIACLENAGTFLFGSFGFFCQSYW